MKKMFLLFIGVVVFGSMSACEKEGLNEIEEIELIDKEDVQSPADRKRN